VTTSLLARLLGLWLVLTVGGMLLDRADALIAMAQLFQSAALLWVTGVFTSLFGLAVVLTHNRWSGGPLTIITTLYGWIALAKGLVFIWLPASAQQASFAALRFDRYYYFYLAVALLVGAYLTYGGFTTGQRSSAAR
jgi:hypothetical protein